MQESTARGMPDFKSFVRTTADENITLNIDGNGIDSLWMSVEHMQQRATTQIPNSNRCVVMIG